MERVQLIFRNLSEISAEERETMGVLSLTDVNGERAINIICDQVTCNQLRMRLGELEICRTLLPEVLAGMLNDYVNLETLEIVIFGIKDGQYLTTLNNTETFTERKVRLSDAVLLHIMEGIPIFIDRKLMDAQAMPFNVGTNKVQIPINTLDDENLNTLLQQALEEENYRLAGYIKEEMNYRNKSNDKK